MTESKWKLFWYSYTKIKTYLNTEYQSVSPQKLQFGWYLLGLNTYDTKNWHNKWQTP